MQGDEAFYYRHNGEGELEGMIWSHVDDFILVRIAEFMEEITQKVKKKLTFPNWKITFSGLLGLMYLRKKIGL